MRSKELEQCWMSFLFNLTRTATFAMMPTEIAFQLSRDTIFTTNSISRTTGRTNLSPEELFATTMTPEMREEFMKQAAEHETQSLSNAHGMRWNIGVKYVEQMLSINVQMQHSVDAIFASIILESWTAFETLSGDAWVILVNNGPAEIANKVSEAKKSREEEGYQSPYDIRTNLGEYLRDVRAYSFQKLYGIKTSYGVALGKKKAQEIFETAASQIILLSAVRNALTHSGGKIDKRFIDQVAMFPEWEAVEIGNSLALNGELVAQLRNAAALTGIAMLNAIDDILTPQPSA